MVSGAWSLQGHLPWLDGELPGLGDPEVGDDEGDDEGDPEGLPACIIICSTTVTKHADAGTLIFPVAVCTRVQVKVGCMLCWIHIYRTGACSR